MRTPSHPRRTDLTVLWPTLGTITTSRSFRPAEAGKGSKCPIQINLGFALVSGSDVEPVVPPPEQAAEQMKDATSRLREKAWMVAPLTTAVPDLEPEERENSAT